jgi:F420-non-reducing hydrogenase iron-sulfur subunit
MAEEFEPNILGILCNWCTYAGADLAGTSRTQYPTNVRVIRIMCTGRLDPAFVLKALSVGADGVLVSGCHVGDCHYLAGNFKSRRRVALLRKLIEEYGYDRERLRMTFISASEGAIWAEVVQDMVNTIKKLGPNPLKQVGEAGAAGQVGVVADDEF